MAFIIVFFYSCNDNTELINKIFKIEIRPFESVFMYGTAFDSSQSSGDDDSIDYSVINYNNNNNNTQDDSDNSYSQSDDIDQKSVDLDGYNNDEDDSSDSNNNDTINYSNLHLCDSSSSDYSDEDDNIPISSTVNDNMTTQRSGKTSHQLVNEYLGNTYEEKAKPEKRVSSPVDNYINRVNNNSSTTSIRNVDLLSLCFNTLSLEGKEGGEQDEEPTTTTTTITTADKQDGIIELEMDEENYDGIIKSIRGVGRKFKRRIVSKKRPIILTPYDDTTTIKGTGFKGLVQNLSGDSMYQLRGDKGNFEERLETTSTLTISVSNLSSTLRRVIPKRLSSKTVQSTIYNVKGTGNLGQFNEGDRVFHFRNLASLGVKKGDLVRVESVSQPGTALKTSKWRPMTIELEYTSPLSNDSDNFFYRMNTGDGSDEDLEATVWYAITPSSRREKETSVIMRFQKDVISTRGLLTDLYLVYSSENVKEERLKAFYSEHYRNNKMISYNFDKEIGSVPLPKIDMGDNRTYHDRFLTKSIINDKSKLSLAETSFVRLLNQEVITYVSLSSKGYNNIANSRISSLFSPFVHSFLNQRIETDVFTDRVDNLNKTLKLLSYFTIAASRRYQCTLNTPQIGDDNLSSYNPGLPQDIRLKATPKQDSINTVERILMEYCDYSHKCDTSVKRGNIYDFLSYRAKNMFNALFKNLLLNTGYQTQSVLNGLNHIISYMLKVTNEVSYNSNDNDIRSSKTATKMAINTWKTMMNTDDAFSTRAMSDIMGYNFSTIFGSTIDYKEEQYGSKTTIDHYDDDDDDEPNIYGY